MGATTAAYDDEIHAVIEFKYNLKVHPQEWTFLLLNYYKVRVSKSVILITVVMLLFMI